MGIANTFMIVVSIDANYSTAEKSARCRTAGILDTADLEKN